MPQGSTALQEGAPLSPGIVEATKPSAEGDSSLGACTNPLPIPETRELAEDDLLGWDDKFRSFRPWSELTAACSRDESGFELRAIGCFASKAFHEQEPAPPNLGIIHYHKPALPDLGSIDYHERGRRERSEYSCEGVPWTARHELSASRHLGVYGLKLEDSPSGSRMKLFVESGMEGHCVEYTKRLPTVLLEESNQMEENVSPHCR